MFIPGRYIAEEVSALPFLKEKIPKKFVNVRSSLYQSYQNPPSGPLAGKAVFTIEEAVELLFAANLGLDRGQLRAALELWGMLGDAVFLRDVLIPDIQRVIELLRPLLHHAPSAALQRGQGRSAAQQVALQCDELAVPDFGSYSAKVQSLIRTLVEKLERDRILVAELLLSLIHI